MPLTCVLKVPVPADQSIPQYKDMLEKRLAALRPRRLAKYHVQAVVFQTPNQTQINQFLHSDYTSTCFSIVEPLSTGGSSGTAPPVVNIQDIKVLTGDIGLASMNRRLSELSLFVERKQLMIECVGSSFKVGDFYIKIGAVSHLSSNRGLIAEISYSSASSNQDAYGVIAEFVESVFGWSINEMLASYVRRKQSNASYTPEDTIVQYFEHFGHMRNAPAQVR